MEHFFGEVINGEMILNETGLLAQKYWHEISDRWPFLEYGNFTVMPNHIYGILIIDRNATMGGYAETRLIASLSNPPKKNGGFAGNKNLMLNETISRMIRWYKGRSTFEMCKINPGFDWQTRFHDHIIRDAASIDRIQNYIAANPSHWKNDKFNSK